MLAGEVAEELVPAGLTRPYGSVTESENAMIRISSQSLLFGAVVNAPSKVSPSWVTV